MTTDASHELYLAHAAANTVPQGNLLSDISPKTMLQAVRIMLAKSTLERKRLPLKLNLDEYQSADCR
jgi:hypothetical protein